MESGPGKVIAFCIFLISVLAGSFAQASVSFSPDWEKISGKTLPDVVFSDAEGRQLRFSEYSGKILILHPMFSHCHSTCPIVASKIAQAYRGLPESEKAKLQILSFSFDPAETDQGLAAFQKLNAGEPNWKVVRATPDQIQQLLDALDFRTLQVGQSNYEHANLVFIANGDRVLRDYVFGADLTPERLQRSIQIAEGRRTGSKSNLLVFAVIGLLVCTFIVVSLWTKNKTQNL